jgi:hypothetical protein
MFIREPSLKEGELGRGNVISEPLPFTSEEKELPPFPTTATYDAKAFEAFDKFAAPGSYFINVGADEKIERNLVHVDMDSIDSQRKWGDMRDLQR